VIADIERHITPLAGDVLPERFKDNRRQSKESS
jgi:hypothetical protein